MLFATKQYKLYYTRRYWILCNSSPCIPTTLKGCTNFLSNYVPNVQVCFGAKASLSIHHWHINNNVNRNIYYIITCVGAGEVRTYVYACLYISMLVCVRARAHSWTGACKILIRIINTARPLQFRPPLWSSGKSSWLQIQMPGPDSLLYQFFWVVGLDRGTAQTDEYNWRATWKKSLGSGLEIRNYGRMWSAALTCILGTSQEHILSFLFFYF
jgi:hypothetical protein